MSTKAFSGLLSVLSISLVFSSITSTVLAQTPNTSSILVTVVDQNDAVVQGATITVTNHSTGAVREAVASSDGTVNIAALPLTGTYSVRVAKSGFADSEHKDLTLRSGETATLRVVMAVGSVNPAEDVTIYGTAEGVRSDPIIGTRLDSRQIEKTPIIGRKYTSLPLLNSAFRQGKGTGDLFVNATYFITGVGSRRAVTFTLDGASNDEGWGRQTAVAAVPVAAIQEVSILTNAFSAEYGWTSGPAFNVVTRSGTNSFRGELLAMFRPGGMQADSFSTKNFCPDSVPSCTPPVNLTEISAVNIPDSLNQFSGSIGGPIIKNRTFFFVAADHTRQDRTAYLSNSLPAFLLPADGNLEYVGHYRQTLLDARIDHRLNADQNLMFRVNSDRMFDDNPQDAVGGTNAPSVARRYSRGAWTAQVNHTWVINSALLNEARFAFLNGDPVTKWEAKELSTTYTRGSGNGAVPFTIGQSRSSDLWSRQFQFADTMSWTSGDHYVRFGGSIVHHRSGGTGNEPGTPVLGTFTFLTNNASRTLPFNQLTITDVQNYQQPINFGIDSYDLGQWLLTAFVQDDWKARPDLTVNLGLRYDRQTLTDAKLNFSPRIGFGWNPGRDAKTAVRGGYGMYYTQIRSNALAGYLVNGLDGLTTYTATPGQTGFPTCLTCVPVNVDPRTIPANQLPARDITIRAGDAEFYRDQFARYGLNFDLLQNYPDEFKNPRSHVFTIGVEREIIRGLFAGADFVHQRLTGIDRTLDLNAPSAFDRTAPGQTRSVAAANATRPIIPVNGGVRQVNVLINFGEADYNGLQTNVNYRGNRRLFASLSYTLSKATNTSEPDGNGIGPNQSIISRLGEEERGPSVVDQRHRAVINFSYRFPLGFSAGTLMQFASARPLNATTGVDNNGDGLLNDRPVVDGAVLSRSAFRGSGTQDVAIFVENRIRLNERSSVTLRIEGFNIFNHANLLGRGVSVWGNGINPNPDFGWFTSSFTNNGGSLTAIPAFANIDPPRMFQLQARFNF